MKSGRVKGGAAIPAVIDTGRRTRSNMAQPVFNASGLNRGVQGGAAQNIIQITSEDLVQNGGQYKLIGGPPIPMEIVTGRRSKQGAATVVYPVDMLGNYDPGFAGYIYKVLTPNASVGYDPSSLIQFLPQNELAGAVSLDYSGFGHNGAYTAAALGQAGVPGMGMTSVGYDGLTSFNDVYSAGLVANFNGAAGTLIKWVQISTAALTDGLIRIAVSLAADGDNRIQIGKSNINNTVFWRYEAAGADKFDSEAAITSTEFMCMAITWDKLADEARYYRLGLQVGVTKTLLGVWAGPLGANGTVVGASSNAPANVFLGNLAPEILYNVALPPAAIAYLSTV